MKITHEGREITVRCTGCYCHEMDMQFGELIEGRCSECGCPKTPEAFVAYEATPVAEPEGESET